MEAKETVMSEEQASNSVDVLSQDDLFQYWIGDEPLWKVIAKAQAEISFKAGQESILAEVKAGDISVVDLTQAAKRDGIKEVVEWVDGNMWKQGSIEQWQAQKKVWGIEETE